MVQKNVALVLAALLAVTLCVATVHAKKDETKGPYHLSGNRVDFAHDFDININLNFGGENNGHEDSSLGDLAHEFVDTLAESFGHGRMERMKNQLSQASEEQSEKLSPFPSFFGGKKECKLAKEACMDDKKKCMGSFKDCAKKAPRAFKKCEEGKKMCMGAMKRCKEGEKEACKRAKKVCMGTKEACKFLVFKDCPFVLKPCKMAGAKCKAAKAICEKKSGLMDLLKSLIPEAPEERPLPRKASPLVLPKTQEA